MSYNYDLLLQMPSSYLKNIARDLGLSGYSALAKQDLVDFLLTNTSLKSLHPFIDAWEKEIVQTEMEGMFLEKQLRDAEINEQTDRLNKLQLTKQPKRRPKPYTRERSTAQNSMMSQFGRLRL